MIPSVLAHQVEQGIKDFLRTTFPVSTPLFHGIVDRLLEEKGEVFKGPYLSIQLPFRPGGVGHDYFPDVRMKHKPYFHQERAFRRLSGPRPKSTIVATGTGSGKTECFLYPILDYCYRHRGEPGIKAILIYPMNALATDQAGRLARIIWGNPNLKGHVTAGLFVGQSEREPRMVMDKDGIITNKDTIRINPPDILLTNYKMLDYLMIRPKDFKLWQQNGPEALQFLVVDELHTFDGAQGTDLACLVRRLKARLYTPENHLCCIGTSATLGSENETEPLRKYAETIFGQPFDEDAIITEARLSAGEFLERSLISHVDVVPPDKAGALDPEVHESYPEFIRHQHQLWFGEEIPKEDFEKEEWRVTLAEQLREHLFFQNLLKSLGGNICGIKEVLGKLERVTPELRAGDFSYRVNLLNSLLVLVSEARIYLPASSEDDNRNEAEAQDGSTSPFLHVRLQLWLRELRRMVGEVSLTPTLRFADDLKEEQLNRHLPVIHCRECGSMGWAGMKRLHESAIIPDLQDFYVGFFSNDPKVVFLFPEDGDLKDQALGGLPCHLCTSCLHLTTKMSPEACTSCGHKELIPLYSCRTPGCGATTK